MNTRNTKIGMSLVLASMLSMGITGCGGDSDATPAATPAATTAVDVTVERGKVYDATVVDSSTPAQVATQKSGQNVYTFATAPTYPVVVTGGWIDVNNDGKQGVEDVSLDIEMKSYSTTITPITTYVADANETIREQKLEALVQRLNANGVGEVANITVEDLLKVPSVAPADVMITANAIYKDFKENKGTATTDDAILSQFSTIQGYAAAGADASAYETVVMQNLANQNLIATFTQAYIDSLTPVVVTPPVSTGGTTGLNLTGYSSIIIYKNISQTFANVLLSAYSSNTGFKFQNTLASCEDYGFSNPTTGSFIKTYSIMDGLNARSCVEADYAGQVGSSGSANILAYYGN